MNHSLRGCALRSYRFAIYAWFFWLCPWCVWFLCNQRRQVALWWDLPARHASGPWCELQPTNKRTNSQPRYVLQQTKGGASSCLSVVNKLSAANHCFLDYPFWVETCGQKRPHTLFLKGNFFLMAFNFIKFLGYRHLKVFRCYEKSRKILNNERR